MNTRVEECQKLEGDDLKQALHLLASSFPLEYSVGVEHFKYFLEKCPEKCYLLIRDNDNLIVGISCILKRKIYYDGIFLDVIGLSYTAISPSHRNFMVSSKLKKVLISYINVNSDLSLGFARKALDNYWYPYGFLGFTNFGCISIELNKKQLPSQFLKIDIFNIAEIEEIISMFDETYVKGLNLIIRTEDDWRYILEKLFRNRRNLYSIKTLENIFIGYVYINENIVEEICINKQYYGKVLNLLSSYVATQIPSAHEIKFQIGLMHPLSKYIKNNLHHSISTRFAWKGGHIARVSNLSKFLFKITESISSKLIIANSGDFSIYYCGVYFTYTHRVLSIKVTESLEVTENEQRQIWQKIVLGVLDAGDYLGDTEADKKILPYFQIMFPRRHPQIPALDQF